MSEVAQLTPEIQQHLAMAFGEPQASVAPPAETTAPIVADQSPITGDQPPVNTTPSTSTPNQSINQPASEELDIIDPNEYLKQNLGYENWDAAKAAIQRLKELEQQATTPAEIKFANEEAKRWMEYFTAGKENELREALNARHQVSSIDTMNDEQKIKLFIKMQNPLYQQQHIDYVFKKEYGFDESQFKDEEGNITDPMGLDFARINALQKVQNDLAKANDFFATYKSKIELPEINQTGGAAINTGIQEDKAGTAKLEETYNNVIAPSLKALTEADLGMSFNIDDAQNQMKFDLGITIDKDDLEAAREKALYFRDWVETSFYDDKGNFQPKKLARAILLEANFDKYVQSAARQAVNAERKRMIEKETGLGERRQFNVDPAVMTELQQKMELAFSV